MNHKNILKFNLSRPIDQRLSHTAIIASIEHSKKKSFLAQIHREMADQFRAIHAKHDLLDSLVSGSSIYRGTEKESRGKTNNKTVIPDHCYVMGSIPGHLDRENSEFASLYHNAGEKAYLDTRAVENSVNQ